MGDIVVEKKYFADEVYYAQLKSGDIETWINANYYSVDNKSTDERIYLDSDKSILNNILEHYKTERNEDVVVLRLSDYVRSYFEAKDLIFSKSPLLHKRYGMVWGARVKALRDTYLEEGSNSDYERSKDYYWESGLNKLIKEQQVTEKEAVYIGQKIQKIRAKREEKDDCIEIV